MFALNEKPIGTSYTATVALLILGFIFIPAVLIVSHPFGYLSLSAAIACSVVCFALAWINWMKFSRLSISSITDGSSKK